MNELMCVNEVKELCVLIDVRFIFRHYVSYVIYSTISVLSLSSSEVN